MPEYLRSLTVVILIATAVFALLQRSFSPLMPPGAFQRRRNAYLALTVCAFLAPGFWFYAIAAAVVVLLARTREENIPALFFAILFAVPPAAQAIPGMGLVNFLLSLDHPRLLALLLLFPAALVLSRRSQQSSVVWPDRLFVGYILLQGTLAFARSNSLTNGLRELVYFAIDVCLPYYVMSRSFSNIGQIKDAFAAFCVAGILLAATGIFESLKHWLLFRSLLDRWATDFSMGNYLLREGLIRALATTGQPIVLGFVLTPALICFLALRPHLTPGVQRNLGGALLVGGLLATVSRGPWVAAVISALAFWAAANSSRMRVAVGLAALISVVALFDTQIPILPSLTSVDQFTVDYRTELFSKSIEVISEHPWFGSEFFRDRLAAKGMLQGEGIVDVVNTYLGIALASGAVGLGFFLTLLAAVLLGTWNSRRRAPRSGKEQGPAGGSLKHLSQPRPHARQSLFSPSLAGRTLFSAFVGMVVCLASASSISVIPWLFWAWMGTAVAYMRIVRTETTHALRSATAAIPEFANDSRSRPRPG
jgi:hypothetical protein